jgi:hypothetical protein
VIVIWVVDTDAARRALVRGLLRCPQPDCVGVLRGWASARTRSIRHAGSDVELTPDRARCASCRVTHVLLPAFYVPRRAYSVEVIGAALLGKADGRGHREIADGLGVPAATVRGWLRGVQRGASALIAQAITAAGSAGVGWFDHRSPASWRGGELAEALDALAVAARGFARPYLDPATAGFTGGVFTGIDYLGLLAAQHRRDMEDRLRVADPEDRLSTLPPWHQVNLITGGRLLTAARGG